ncbi:MAG: APH(3') family aminoglycoside O-phosphotransferase [Clostridiales bacterium]|nr:APH(3') family aminoglycoside O-phosphotransferase [Clostridiales bacterium]
MKILDIIGDNYFGNWTSTRTGCRAVIIKDGQILMSYETKNDQWMIPGGGLEENESDEECVIREVAEECGVVIRASSCVLEIDEYYEDCKWLNIYFLAEVTGETERHLTNQEIEAGMEPRWMPLGEILQIFSTHQEYDGKDEMRRGMYYREYTALREILLSELPEAIREKVSGKDFRIDDLGKSGSRIFLFDDCVLKCEKILDPAAEEAEPFREDQDQTVEVMRYLKGKLPVPEVLAYEKDETYRYLLMSRIPGNVACDPYYMEHPKEMIPILADALKLLWSIDISGCPRKADLDTILSEAEYRVKNDLVDLSDAEPETFGEGGFKDAEELLSWLKENKPSYEPVLSHGDFCLPNIFIRNGKLSGLIDLGNTGTGDKWMDIALCYRSLKHNADGRWGSKVYSDIRPEMLFEELGIEPDWDRINYYILLDELF